MKSPESFPHISAASIYDAISYYLDHQDEIEREILENRRETLQKTNRFVVDNRGFVHFGGAESKS